MLKHTFVHLPGVGRKTESRFWRQGLLTWEDFLAARAIPGLGPFRLSPLRALIEESLAHWGEPRYFASRLPGPEHWRLFNTFRARIAYLDIETAGSFWPHFAVTVVGLYDGTIFRQFVQGYNLAEFPQALAAADILVTFNGSQFDLPVLQAYFPELAVPPIHLDLRFILARLGYKGGLKRLEPRFGIRRPREVAGLDGFDAVLLWERHQRGDRTALDLLLKYNREDVLNLEPLMLAALEKCCEDLLGEVRALETSDRWPFSPYSPITVTDIEG